MNLTNKIATILFFFFIILFLPVLPERCPLKIKTTEEEEEEEEEGCPNSARSKKKERRRRIRIWILDNILCKIILQTPTNVKI
jgi:predicted secreted protein